MKLLNFPRRCLQVPGRGGRWWNLARLVDQQLAEDSDPAPLVSTDSNASKLLNTAADHRAALGSWR